MSSLRSNQDKFQFFHNFSQVEYDSAWHAENALLANSRPDFSTQLFEHHLEEMGHGKMFYLLAESYKTRVSFKRTSQQRVALEYDNPKNYFSYCYYGELRAYKQFEELKTKCKDKKVQSMLDKILKEESGHANTMKSILYELGHSDKEILKGLQHSKWAYWKQYYLKIGKKVASFISSIILGLTYFLIGPLVGYFIRKQLK